MNNQLLGVRGGGYITHKHRSVYCICGTETVVKDRRSSSRRSDM